MKNLQAIYEAAYQKEWDKRANKPDSTKTIGMNVGGQDKTYVERNFFWCGFNWISFKMKGKNFKLRKALRKQGLEPEKSYGGGFSLSMNSVGYCGNGDYEIQRVAYGAVTDYLRSLNYDVYLYSRLD